MVSGAHGQEHCLLGLCKGPAKLAARVKAWMLRVCCACHAQPVPGRFQAGARALMHGGYATTELVTCVFWRLGHSLYVSWAQISWSALAAVGNSSPAGAGSATSTPLAPVGGMLCMT